MALRFGPRVEADAKFVGSDKECISAPAARIPDVSQQLPMTLVPDGRILSIWLTELDYNACSNGGIWRNQSTCPASCKTTEYIQCRGYTSTEVLGRDVFLFAVWVELVALLTNTFGSCPIGIGTSFWYTHDGPSLQTKFDDTSLLRVPYTHKLQSSLLSQFNEMAQTTLLTVVHTHHVHIHVVLSHAPRAVVW